MRDYTLGHISDAVLLRDLKSLIARDREATATLLAHIAEVDARRLYAPAGYSSMFTYCVQELHFSEDAAYKRIQVARAGRRFPQLLDAVVEGRVHLTGAGLLAPHLTAANVDHFIEAATHRGKSEIEEWLAAQSTSRGLVRSSESSICPIPQLAPAQVRGADVPIPFDRALEETSGDPHVEGAGSGDGSQLAPAQVHSEAASLPTPSISGPRFLVQFTIDQETHHRLRHVQALLSHAVPMNDLGGLFRRALEALAAEVETKRLGAVSRPARVKSASTVADHGAEPRTRHIPAHIRRAVWERDRGQCTFVSTSGHHCGERRFLEFDHVDPIARGGKSTVHGLRLRCSAHNQLEAERAFGAGFMRTKRDQARAVRTKAKARTEAGPILKERARAEERERMEAIARTKARERAQDIVEGLRSLGCRGSEARRAAEHALMLGSTTLEDQMRAALSFVSRRNRAVSARSVMASALGSPQPP